MMLGRMLFAILALLLAALPKPAEADGCPSQDRQEVEKRMAHAPSCDRAMALFRACRYGASGDIGFGEIVVRKCERGFRSALSRAARRAYDAKIKHCWRKYRHQTGTLYRSFEAFCAAGVAQSYAHRAARKKK